MAFQCGARDKSVCTMPHLRLLPPGRAGSWERMAIPDPLQVAMPQWSLHLKPVKRTERLGTVSDLGRAERLEPS